MLPVLNIYIFFKVNWWIDCLLNFWELILVGSNDCCYFYHQKVIVGVYDDERFNIILNKPVLTSILRSGMTGGASVKHGSHCWGQKTSAAEVTSSGQNWQNIRTRFDRPTTTGLSGNALLLTNRFSSCRSEHFAEGRHVTFLQH